VKNITFITSKKHKDIKYSLTLKPNVTVKPSPSHFCHQNSGTTTDKAMHYGDFSWI